MRTTYMPHPSTTRRRLIIAVTTFILAGFVTTSFGSYYASLSSLQEKVTEAEPPLTSDNIYVPDDHGAFLDAVGVGMPIKSLSGGISHYRKGETTDTMLTRADKALYRAKAEGRDRVLPES